MTAECAAFGTVIVQTVVATLSAIAVVAFLLRVTEAAAAAAVPSVCPLALISATTTELMTCCTAPAVVTESWRSLPAVVDWSDTLSAVVAVKTPAFPVAAASRIT